MKNVAIICILLISAVACKKKETNIVEPKYCWQCTVDWYKTDTASLKTDTSVVYKKDTCNLTQTQIKTLEHTNKDNGTIKEGNVTYRISETVTCKMK